MIFRQHFAVPPRSVHDSAVSDRLPWLYGGILLLEVVGLAVVYATDAPGPSDPLSVGLGWGGLGSMIAMLVYSVARRSRTLRQWARLSSWLHLHIFLGVQGVVLIAFHCAHLLARSTFYLMNPGILNLAAMGIVVGSGLFGRYLYAQLPRAIGGEQLAADEVDAELAALGPLPEAVTALWQGTTAATSLPGLVRADLATRRAVARLGALTLTAEQRRLATRKIRLERRRASLSAAQRVFRNWIVLHRPIAALMYVLSFVHVALAYMFSPSLGF